MYVCISAELVKEVQRVVSFSTSLFINLNPTIIHFHLNTLWFLSDHHTSSLEQLECS